MATNVGTGHRGHALAHFTLVSLDLSRFRAIRTHRALVHVALVSAMGHRSGAWRWWVRSLTWVPRFG